QWGESGECSGTLTLVYDHHKHDLARRIMAIQHESHDIIVATLHVHLDHDNCLETLVLKGDARAVKATAQGLAACKGVKYGIFNRAPNGPDLR
ncbi:MAG: nickel-responsive transcriptional regulator NikR, partial [Desulfovibrio sp.]|nr:nickel-responsive transcriptional regulator NikR [Desulfovibrio sp.]